MIRKKSENDPGDTHKHRIPLGHCRIFHNLRIARLMEISLFLVTQCTMVVMKTEKYQRILNSQGKCENL